jgi:hypothetical protein
MAENAKRPHLSFSKIYGSVERKNDDEKAMLHLPPSGDEQSGSPSRLNAIMMCSSSTREHGIKGKKYYVGRQGMEQLSSMRHLLMIPSTLWFQAHVTLKLVLATSAGGDSLTRNLSSAFIANLNFWPRKIELKRLHLSFCWKTTEEN